MRAVKRALLLLSLSALSWASALEVVGAPTARGAIGDYVTLAFHLAGFGEYTYTVAAAPPWEPLARSGRVQVAGTGFVSVTLRVPRLAQAEVPAPVVITFVNAAVPADTATGTGYVTAEGASAVSITAPASVEGATDQPLAFSIIVGNRGNLPDVFDLTGTSSMWVVRFEADQVGLAPGEERELRVVLDPVGSVTSGFRTIVYLTATSRSDPAAGTQAFVEASFFDGGSAGAPRPASAPRVDLAVGTGLTGRMTIDGSGASATLDYDVNPRLSGDLSDFVRASAEVGRFAGSLADPFEEVPSRMYLGLTGAAWDAAAAIGDGSYSLSGAGLVGAWRLGGSGSYMGGTGRDALALTAFAVSQDDDLDLQFSGSTRWSAVGRHDGLAAVYRTPLSDSVLLTLGGGLAGTWAEDRYAVTLGVSESLSYQTQAFDVTQTYSGVPLAGIHAVGLSGGLRSAGPFGVRAATSLQLGGSAYTWSNSVTVSAAPAPGVGVSLTGGWQDATFGTTWSVRPTLSLTYRAAGAQVGLAVSYAHTGVVRGDAAVSDRYRAGASLGLGPVSADASATYTRSEATGDEPGGARLEAMAGVTYRPGLGTTAAAEFEYASDTGKGEGSAKFGVSWTEAWTPTIATQLSYERTQATDYDSGRYSQDERIALVGQFSDVGLEGLNLSAGYALSSQTGLLAGVAPLRHDLSFRVSYVLRFSFDTPRPVVDMFGGRKGGEVRGVAFLDRDLDGRFGPGDESLVGVTIGLGDEATVTGPDGSYDLRVPGGVNAWSVGAGLPASLRLAAAGQVAVTENTVQVIDLPFVPVVSVSIMLFDDLDDDGMRGAGENGIAYGGVIVEGPVNHELMVDARGGIVISDLLPGRYVIRADPDRLPRRYRPTTEPITIVLREGDRPVPVTVGAGAPPREVATTFAVGSLAVIARASATSVAVGDTLELTALVTGRAERVLARLGEIEFELVDSGGRWTGTVVVPEGFAPGRTSVMVTASAGDQTATTKVEVVIR